MKRPEVEEFKRLTSEPESAWGMADCDVVDLCDYILHLEGRQNEARKIVDEQADDVGLWLQPVYIMEDDLQKALRRLHAAIEGKSPEQCAIEVLTK